MNKLDYSLVVDLERLDALAAQLAAAVEALGKTANYLDELQDNMLRNDADTRIDPCEAPEGVAEDLRAIDLPARAVAMLQAVEALRALFAEGADEGHKEDQYDGECHACLAWEKARNVLCTLDGEAPS